MWLKNPNFKSKSVQFRGIYDLYENQNNIAYLQSRNRNGKLWHSEQLLIILEILDNIADECIAWAIKNDSEKY